MQARRDRGRLYGGGVRGGAQGQKGARNHSGAVGWFVCCASASSSRSLLACPCERCRPSLSLLRSQGRRGLTTIDCSSKRPPQSIVVSAPIRALAIFAHPLLPLVLHRNAIYIKPALNLHPLLLWQQNRGSGQIVSVRHNLLLIRCYICAMKVRAVMSKRRVENAARRPSAMIPPRHWTNSTSRLFFVLWKNTRR